MFIKLLGKKKANILKTPLLAIKDNLHYQSHSNITILVLYGSYYITALLPLNNSKCNTKDGWKKKRQKKRGTFSRTPLIPIKKSLFLAETPWGLSQVPLD